MASGTVRGVVQGDQGAQLNVDGLGVVGLSDVKQIF
jgi:flagellar basal-body rod modification protein FlgD